VQWIFNVNFKDFSQKGSFAYPDPLVMPMYSVT
jgi:hypothetical protein